MMSDKNKMFVLDKIKISEINHEKSNIKIIKSPSKRKKNVQTHLFKSVFSSVC